MSAYYNENDPYAAQWLRNLIAAGHLPAGDVDERDIREVEPPDVQKYTQCHFFAGIGGWPYALRLAGWPDDRPVWTGSCPCQPFSVAGKRKGIGDERHLWPTWFQLIKGCRPRPKHVFGEQVPNAIGHGWLDGVCDDLEAEGYSVGAVVLGAHSVGAPHIRQRLFWVGESKCNSRNARRAAIQSGEGDGKADQRTPVKSGRPSNISWLGSPNQPGSQGWRIGPFQHPDQLSAWSPSDFIWCRDSKWRRIGTGIQPVAHGVSARIPKLRAAGNSIVPQTAAAFIAAYMEVRP